MAGGMGMCPGGSGMASTGLMPRSSGTAAMDVGPGMSRTTNMGMWPGGSGMAAGGGWSGGSGFPEWWPAIAACALGPNFFPSDPDAASVFLRPSMASDNNIDTGGVPVQAPSAHRGGGRRGAAAVVNKAAPVEATSSGRKRKRGTRPPIPTCSSDEILDLTIDPADIADASVANWCDNNLRILCEICAQEVGLGNRSSTHLNKTGYKNLINKFKERTGLLYTRRQFKNKWDKLKAEHTIWKKLIKQSGIGWKEGTRNIDMPDDWWLKMDKEIKGVMWFKEQGLQNEENISKMFDGLLNTGDDHWNPSSGVAPSHSLGERSTNYADEGEADNDEDDSDPDEVTEVLPTSGKGKKVVDIDSKKGKKPKTSGGHWFQEQMEQMVALNERTVASCESVAKNEDKSGCSIWDVMALVKSCGAAPGTNEHFIATLVFTKRAKREIFMTLDTPKERFDWLSRKHQWMTRNDVV